MFMWKLILVTIVILAIVFVLLAIKIIFVKNGKFPNTHIAGNKHMRKKGIGCAKSMDKEEQGRKSLLDRMDE